MKDWFKSLCTFLFFGGIGVGYYFLSMFILGFVIDYKVWFNIVLIILCLLGLGLAIIILVYGLWFILETISPIGYLIDCIWIGPKKLSDMYYTIGEEKLTELYEETLKKEEIEREEEFRILEYMSEH